MKVNEMTFEKQVEIRRMLEHADATIFCFTERATVYAVMLDEIPLEWIKQTRAAKSHGGMLKARIRPTAKDIAALKNRVELGKLGDLLLAYEVAYKNATGKQAPKNNGWMFECAVTERMAGETWEPDSRPFWMAADVEINGTGYQVKSYSAEYFNEKSLQRAIDETGY